MTKLGIMIEGQEGLNWERWRTLCADAEELGFHALRRSDHLFSVMGVEGRECIDPWVSLGLAAEWTKRIRIGVMVSPMTFYQPATLARAAASVDQLSGGRLDFGVGAGWNQPEHERHRVPFLTLKERMDRLENGIRIIRESWRLSATRPVQDPIWLLMGGTGEKRALKIVGREAGEWNLTRLDEETFKQKSGVVDASCREAGREPSSIRRSIMTMYLIGRDSGELRRRAEELGRVLPRFAGLSPDEIIERASESALVGTPAEIVARIQEFARLGVDLFMLQHFLMDDRDALRLLADEVMPALA